MPRVVVPTESEERSVDYSHRKRRIAFAIVALLVLVGAGLAGAVYFRQRVPRASADTLFVSAPSWPKAEVPPAPTKASVPTKEFLLQVGAFLDKKDADALAARLTGMQWPVSVIAPLRATDSLHKVIVSGITDRATARRVADSIGTSLHRRVTILEPSTTPVP